MKLEEYRKQLTRDPEYLAAQEKLRPLLELADMVLSQRMARDWSQAELAEHVGTKQANISRLESGLSNPSIKFLQRLAEALDAKLIIHLEPRAVSVPPQFLVELQETGRSEWREVAVVPLTVVFTPPEEHQRPL